MPLVWASRIKGQPLTERVNGTDLMVDLCEAASEAGQSELKIAGCHCPDFGFETEIKNITEIASIIAEANPAFVFVGLGSPKQDVLINMLRLKLPNVWWLGVGVSFSFVGGEIPRAPEWAKKSGFEWLYRLCSEPKRLFKRYLVQGVPFLAMTLLVSGFERLWNRPPQSPQPPQPELNVDTKTN